MTYELVRCEGLRAERGCRSPVYGGLSARPPLDPTYEPWFLFSGNHHNCTHIMPVRTHKCTHQTVMHTRAHMLACLMRGLPSLRRLIKPWALSKLLSASLGIQTLTLNELHVATVPKYKGPSPTPTLTGSKRHVPHKMAERTSPPTTDLPKNPSETEMAVPPRHTREPLVRKYAWRPNGSKTQGHLICTEKTLTNTRDIQIMETSR